MSRSDVVGEDLGLIFARHAVSSSFRALPSDAVRAAKQSTLDTLGVMLGASGQMAAMSGIIELLKDTGGKQESTVLGFGGKIPAVNAAFVNGAMAHGLDFDDHLPEGHHPSSSLVPSLFAVAQRVGGVSGEDFITALALGQDLFARLRKNVAWKQDWLLTPVLGAFSAAAACGKLLRLNERQIVNAFGIASCQAAGTFQSAYGTGGDLRGIYAGFAAKAGLFSALLAQAGLTGTAAPMEGKAGFLEVYFGEWDRNAMVSELGIDFQGDTILYKLWPSCGVTHAYIHTALQLLGGPCRTDDVSKIEVYGGDFARRLSEPVELRRRPATVLDAKFSIPYTVALALVRGTVGVGDFSEERRRNPDILSVADRIEFVADMKYDWGKELPAGAVRITRKNGETLFAEAQHDETPGASKRPLSWSELTTKFVDCSAYAVHPVSGDVQQHVIRGVKELETSIDVCAVVELLG